MELKYEETFTAYVDFLGFSEASRELDDKAREEVLRLLLSLVYLRSEFQAAIDPTNDGSRRWSIKPAISTFSDHIVISYGLETLREVAPEKDEKIIAIIITSQIGRLVSTIAAAALRLGFLIRGAATIGKLYHSKGVVFGEALVEVTELESHTAIYPRIVLSSALTQRSDWKTQGLHVSRDDDGVSCIDYITPMLFHASLPGTNWNADSKAGVTKIIGSKLDELQCAGKLNKFAKWTWFARHFRAGLSRLPPQVLTEMGISMDAITWGR
jgi:hypothetical protein